VQKIRNEKFSTILKKPKVNFLLDYFFEERDFEHFLAFVEMCAKKT